MFLDCSVFYKLTGTGVTLLVFYPVPARAPAPAPYLAPPPSLSAPASSEQVQDPTTALNEPEAAFYPVVQAADATPPAQVDQSAPVPSLAAHTTQRVKFESDYSSPTSAQQQEKKEQQSDDRKRESPKTESKAVISLRNSQIRKYTEDMCEGFFCSRLFFCVFVPADFVFVG